jgi:hypothetical protein
MGLSIIDLIFVQLGEESAIRAIEFSKINFDPGAYKLHRFDKIKRLKSLFCSNELSPHLGAHWIFGFSLKRTSFLPKESPWNNQPHVWVAIPKSGIQMRY